MLDYRQRNICSPLNLSFSRQEGFRSPVAYARALEGHRQAPMKRLLASRETGDPGPGFMHTVRGNQKEI